MGVGGGRGGIERERERGREIGLFFWLFRALRIFVRQKKKKTEIRMRWALGRMRNNILEQDR